MKSSLTLLIILSSQSSIQNVSPKFWLVGTREHDEVKENPGKTWLIESLIEYHNMVHECKNRSFQYIFYS